MDTASHVLWAGKDDVAAAVLQKREQQKKKLQQHRDDQRNRSIIPYVHVFVQPTLSYTCLSEK